MTTTVPTTRPTRLSVLAVVLACALATPLAAQQALWEIGLTNGSFVTAVIDSVDGAYLCYRNEYTAERSHVARIVSIVIGRRRSGQMTNAIIGGSIGALVAGVTSSLWNVSIHPPRLSTEMLPAIGASTAIGALFGLFVPKFVPDREMISLVGLTTEQRLALIGRLLLDEDLKSAERR